MKNNIFFVFFFLITFGFSACNNEDPVAKTFQNKCGNCHGNNGEGLKQLIPPIANSDYLQKHHENLICIIRNGMSDTIVVNGIMHHQIMPDNKDMSVIEMTNLVNYINRNWYPDRPHLTTKDVREKMDSCF